MFRGSGVSNEPADSPAWSNPPIVRHRLDGERYTSVDFFLREWAGMWTKVWLLLGREDAVADAGSFQTEEVGAESIIMVRQSDGSLKAFYNVCQHRGSRLTFAPGGNARRFSCPYHGWSYGIDGRLTDVLDPEDFPQNPCDHLRLVELPCETFAGFVWVNMDPHCGSLRDFLGPLWDEWSVYRPDNWTRVTALTARMPCNWKVLQDNFCESYHLQTVHPQLRDSHEDDYRETRFDRSIEGHSRMIMKGATPSRKQHGDHPPLPAGLAERLRIWELDPAEFADRPFDARQALQRQMRRLGPARGHPHYTGLREEQLTDAHHYNLFPNCSLTFGPDGVLLQRMRPHATDPNKCTFDHWYYASVGADDAVVTLQTNVRVDGIESQHEVFDYGSKPMGIIPDQDGSVVLGQQLGMRSRGYRGAYPAGQEERISAFHQLIDDYIAGTRP